MTYWSVNELMDLERYPIGERESESYDELLGECRAALTRDGMFSLPGFVSHSAIKASIAALQPAMMNSSFTHAREHNIYFKDDLPGIEAEHPALQRCRTVNHTLCADQLDSSPLTQVYEVPPLAQFLADAMEVKNLYVMADHMARFNVMAYRHGEALNWHFDRTHSTTTLLLQNAQVGGDFQYRRGLRTPTDPNYDGVARLLRGQDSEVRTRTLEPGTLNVFLGQNTAHRITTVRGSRERLIAVFSFYEKPGVLFTAQERLGFYGRST